MARQFLLPSGSYVNDSTNTQFMLPDGSYFLGSGALGGYVKVWSGTAWNKKPVKVWNGSAWVIKPLKFYSGTIFKATT